MNEFSNLVARIKDFRTIIGVVFIFWFVLGSSFDAYASKRVALVVGNNDYTTLPALNNAAKDARDMAQTLRDLGWEVVDIYNSSQRDIGRAIDKFEGQLWTADASLFFYAGHGIQARGENWIVPVDAKAESEVDLKYEAIPAREVLSAMKRADVPVNIIILDACRDNPLKKRTRSSSRGLQVPEVPVGLRGTTIMFSAAPGEVAQDGPKGGNGVFTGNLLRELKKPGLTIEAVFKATSRGVNAATNRSQMPWFNSSLSGDFYFNEAKPEVQVAAVAPAPALPSSDNVELMYWQSVSGSDDVALLQSYLSQYPDGRFVELAKARITSLANKLAAAGAAQARLQEDAYWKTVSASSNATGLQSYLAKYPNGQFVDLAKLELKILENRPVKAALPLPIQPTAPSTSNFKKNLMTEIVYQDQDGKLLRFMDIKKKNGSFIENDKGVREENQLYLGVFRMGQSLMTYLRKEYESCLTGALGLMPSYSSMHKEIKDNIGEDVLSMLDEEESLGFMFHIGRPDKTGVGNDFFTAEIRKKGDNELEIIGKWNSMIENAYRLSAVVMDSVSVKSNVIFNRDLGVAQKISETWRACGKEAKFEFNLLVVKDVVGNQLSF